MVHYCRLISVNTKEVIYRERFVPHYPLLYRVALSVLGNEADACDAVQDAMVKVWGMSVPELGSVDNPKAYVLRVLRTTAIDMLRRRARENTTVGCEAESLPDMSFDPGDADGVEFIRRAVDCLPAAQREVMRLSAYEGLPTDEIAEATGFTTDNVRQLLSRARKRLRTIFR